MNGQKFTNVVARAMQRLYPTKLAAEWDNVGLLWEAFSNKPCAKKVLLTIDLTRQVATEAIALDVSVLISYHPVIFRPLKSFTTCNAQQETLMRLAQEGVSVYCPHTSCDAVAGGMNDWFADCFVAKEQEKERKPAIPTKVPGYSSSVGMGRVVHLREPVAVEEILARGKSSIVTCKKLIRLYRANNASGIKISSIGFCVGSGSSVYREVEDVDLFITGEMTHHELLEATQSNTSVILCGHHTSEFGYLHIMQQRLSEELQSLTDESFAVEVSKADLQAGHFLT